MSGGSSFTALVDVQLKIDTATMQAELDRASKSMTFKVPDMGSAGDTMKPLGDEMERTGQKAKGLSATIKDFGVTVGKVFKFAAATAAIGMVRTSLQSAMQAVKDYDSALVDFKKVSDLSGDSLTKYGKKVGELGTSVARTRTEMIQAATQFRKSGYSDEDSAVLAKTASLYQNISDETLSASDASSVIISQMKAFNITAKDSTHIIDSINEVSNNFAVSSSDIGKGLTSSGSALSTYGNTFENTIGLVTAGTEVMHGKAQQVARGLNTVAGRVAKNGDALAKYGVSVKDSNGNLRSTFDILKDLSPQWDKMSNSEKVSLGNTLAGVNQYKVFAAVMGNFDTALKANETALNSNGSAMKENSKYMDSIEAKVQGLKTAWQELVLGNGGLVQATKVVMDLGIKFLELANKIGGLPIALTAVAGGATALVYQIGKIGQTAKQLEELTTFNILAKGFETVTGKASQAGASIKGLASTVIGAIPSFGTMATFFTTGLGITALVAGFAAAAVGLEALNQKFDYIHIQSKKVGEDAKWIKEYNKELSNQSRITKENVSSAMGQADYYSDLSSQLYGLVDANGKVKAGEEGRAQFIIDTLNTALGTEMTLTDGVISGLVGEKEAIDQLIQSKKAEAEMSAYEDDYENAIKNEAKLVKAAERARQEYYEATKAFNETGSASDAKRVEETRKALQREEEALAKNEETKSHYEEMQKAFAEGNLELVQKLAEGNIESNTSIVKSIKDRTNSTVEDLKAERDSLIEQRGTLVQLRDQFDKGSKSYEYYSQQLQLVDDELDANEKASSSAASATDVVGDAAELAGTKASGSATNFRGLKDTIAGSWNADFSNITSALDTLWSKAKRVGEKIGEAFSFGGKGKAPKGYAKGGETEAGVALVGEEGREIVQSRDSAYIVGTRGAEIVNLQKGDYVYTNDETERMLRGKKSSPKLKARASGTKDTLDTYFDTEEDDFAKGKTNAQRYHHATTYNADYYKKYGWITTEEYKSFMKDSAKTLFSTMDDLYKAGKISTQDYYNDLVKYANDYNAKGVLTVKEYFDYIEKSKDLLVDSIKDSLDSLKDKSKNTVESLESKFGAFSTYAEEQKEVLQKQLETINQKESELNGTDLASLEKKLEEAKSSKTVKVYSASKGWHYEADAKAVEDAQKAIDEYKLNQEKQAIQDQIDAYDDFLSEQEKYLNKYIQELELGQKIEEVIFKDREQNFDNFKDSYLDYIKEMLKAQEEYMSIKKENDLISNADNLYVAMSKTGQIFYSTTSQDAANKLAGLAKGTLAVSNSGMYNVNELGDEIFIPPTGNSAYLQKGTGVIPANLTRNLMELGNYNLNQLASRIGGLSNGNTDNHSVNIENLTVQSNNANDFVRQLQNLSIVNK